MRSGKTALYVRAGGGALRLAMLSAALVALAAGGRVAAQQANRAELDVSTLPTEVREALDRATRVYPQPMSGASWSQADVLNRNGHALYQLQGSNGRGNKIEMEVTGAGRIVEVEEHGIPMSEVPAAVLAALEARMPEFTPTRIEAIFQAERPEPVCYGFEGEDPDGRWVEIYISADGKRFLN